ncbi:MAG: SDR family NAD(P)-dependent oxidoreductase [Enterobacteriaceae bacterium]
MLSGKTAIITGASRGIGAATARLLAQRGANVVINYAANQAAAEDVLDSIQQAGGKGLAIQADARSQEQMGALVEQTVKTYGRLDIMVHNAGLSFAMKPFAQMAWPEFIQKTHDELQCAFIATQLALPHMQRQKYGRLIYVSSSLSHQPGENFIAHGVSKGALNTFVRYIAQEMGRDGICANIVAPGLTDTDSTAFMPEEAKQYVASQIPLGRIGRPEDIARTIAFYASDDAAYLTGSYLAASGGGELY